MRRPFLRSRRFAAALAIVLVAGACGDSGSSTEAEGAGSADDAVSADWSELDGVDVEALAFTGTTTDGTTFSGADVVGQDVLLWFWAPW